MTPFYRAEYPPEAYDPDHISKLFGISFDRALEVIEVYQGAEIFQNDMYEVVVRKTDHELFGPMAHLSIKRRDKEVIHDWRDLQHIKNSLTEAECEAIEIYPAESRLLDTANQYHLWVFLDKSVRIPLGFGQRLVMDETEAVAVGARQRPFGPT